MLGRTCTFSPYFAANFGLRLIPRNLAGFASTHAAFKYFDAVGAGECSFVLNGDPYPQTYYSLTREDVA